MNLPSNAIPQGRNIFEAIFARRTVRAYALDVVGKHTIQTLLEAAIRAPTAMQEEPWAFVVIQNRQLLNQLSDRAKPIFIEEMRHRNAQGVQHSFEHFPRQDF